MKFIVEFQLKPGTKNAVIDTFDLRGPNRNPGVLFHNAWVGTHEDVIFVLGESADEALVVAACESWRNASSYEIHQVVDIEQF